jgi:hypothetical protein
MPATPLAVASGVGFRSGYDCKANGEVMSLMTRVADAHFRKDPNGRLVFIPFTRRGKCYVVDSKADEEKIRAFVNMYRIPDMK